MIKTGAKIVKMEETEKDGISGLHTLTPAKLLQQFQLLTLEMHGGGGILKKVSDDVNNPQMQSLKIGEHIIVFWVEPGD